MHIDIFESSQLEGLYAEDLLYCYEINSSCIEAGSLPLNHLGSPENDISNFLCHPFATLGIDSEIHF